MMAKTINKIKKVKKHVTATKLEAINKKKIYLKPRFYCRIKTVMLSIKVLHVHC